MSWGVDNLFGMKTAAAEEERRTGMGDRSVESEPVRQ